MTRKTPPGADPANPLPVPVDAGDVTPEMSTAKSEPQWVLLLQPLTVDTPDRDPVTYGDGRLLRLSAPRARALIANGQARLATERDLKIGAATARDLCPAIEANS